jgi:membrane protein DedA with SNARE-associated domain
MEDLARRPQASSPDEAQPEANEELTSAQRRVIQGLIVTTLLVSTLGTAFLPYLLVEHPILLLLTSADGRNIVLLTPRVEWHVLVPLAVARRILAMLSTYGVGILYGRALLEAAGRRLPLVHKFMTGFERVFLRFRAPSLVLWPSYACCTIAGVTRTPLRTFVPWMALGQVVFVLFTYLVGSAASRWTELLVTWLRAHLFETTVVCLVVVAAQQLSSWLRRRRGVRRVAKDDGTRSKQAAIGDAEDDPPAAPPR